MQKDYLVKIIDTGNLFVLYNYKELSKKNK